MKRGKEQERDRAAIRHCYNKIKTQRKRKTIEVDRKVET